MTTETNQVTRNQGSRVLLGATAGSLAAGLAIAGVGALTAGSPAGVGALIGTALVVLVFAGGSFVVDEVARLMPAAALLVALLTYTLQVLAMGLAFVAISGSGLLDATADRGWLAGAVIGGTAGWLALQIVLATRQRIPVYDLRPAGPRPTTAQAGER
jgi:ATP synthase protein I